MSSQTPGVSIRLTHALDDDAEYGAFTNVKADIMYADKGKIGYITATIVNRQAIPEGGFMSAMDGHSADLQYVGVTAYEPKAGRTRLQSLARYDDIEFDTMCIRSFHIDHAYKQGGNSDIGATALQQFLYHPFIKGNLPDGLWNVSSAIYMMEPTEAMTPAELTALNAKRASDRLLPYSQRDEHADRAAEAAEDRAWGLLAYKDSPHFLRNGFFQDPALARLGGNAGRFLVASYGQWDKAHLESHAEAEATAARFYVAPKSPPEPTGKDAEIFKAVMTACNALRRMPTPDESIRLPTELQATLVRLVSEGGSLERAHALHVACGNNTKEVVNIVLQLSPQSINARDATGSTPLMVAAASAAGRKSDDGIDDTIVVNKLVAARADKQLQNPSGMTAYGIYKKTTNEFYIMMQSMMGEPVGGRRPAPHPTELTLEAKLMPPGGPTAADLSGGEGPESGFMDYTAEDRDICGYQSDESRGDY